MSAVANTNVSLSAIKTLLGAETDSLFTICKDDAGLINKWSKYKPIRDAGAGANWPAGSNSKYGFNLPTDWSYLHPRGGSPGGSPDEPGRLGDFRGYEHSQANSYPTVQCRSADCVIRTLYPLAGNMEETWNFNTWLIKMFKSASNVRILPSDLGYGNYYFGFKITVNGVNYYRTFGNVSTTDDSGTSITLDASLEDPTVQMFYNLPYGSGTYNWHLSLFSNSHSGSVNTGWTTSLTGTLIPFPSGSINNGAYTLITSGSFTVLPYIYLSSTSATWTFPASLDYKSVWVYYAGAGHFTITDKPSWLDIYVYDGTGTLRKEVMGWNSGYEIRLSPNEAYNSYKTAYITITANGVNHCVTVTKSASAVGVSYTWNVHNDTDYVITPISPGMTTSSTVFDIDISHTLISSSMIYKNWAIRRTAPTTATLASGSDGDAATGYGLRTSNQNSAHKSGTLSQSITDGDSIVILIDPNIIEE